MTEQQRRAAATVSLLLIVVSALGITTLLGFTLFGSDPLGDRFPGRQFILLIHDPGGLQTMLKALPIIVSVGLTVLATYKLKDWQYYATVAVALLGVIACAWLYNEIKDPIEARRYWAYSPILEISDYNSFTGQARSFLMIMGLWFAGILASQLGIKNLGGTP